MMQAPIVVISEGAKGVDWVSAGGGLIGVLLGAALTYFVTSRFERKRVHDERLARSYSLAFAILKISDDLTKMELDLRAALDASQSLGSPPEDLWTKLMSSIGYPDPITIPAADLTVVALTRDHALTQQIGEVENSHRIFLTSLSELERQKAKFETFELETSVGDDDVVSFVAKGQEIARVAPTIIRLRSLSRSVSADLPKAADQARNVAEKIGPHLKRHYKFKHFVEMEFPRNAVGQVIAAYDLPARANADAPKASKPGRFSRWWPFGKN